jgi:hypothetical protein
LLENGRFDDEMPAKKSYAYLLENPQPIVPHPVHASASFFYDDSDPQVIEPTFESYMEHVYPVALEGSRDDEVCILYLLFNDSSEFWNAFEL